MAWQNCLLWDEIFLIFMTWNSFFSNTSANIKKKRFPRGEDEKKRVLWEHFYACGVKTADGRRKLFRKK